MEYYWYTIHNLNFNKGKNIEIAKIWERIYNINDNNLLQIINKFWKQNSIWIWNGKQKFKPLPWRQNRFYVLSVKQLADF